jgi:hypothetical protein
VQHQCEWKEITTIAESAILSFSLCEFQQRNMANREEKIPCPSHHLGRGRPPSSNHADSERDDHRDTRPRHYQRAGSHLP